MTSNDENFQAISNAILNAYQDGMEKYLNSKSDGSITDADVITMIMNLSVRTCVSIYYSLKQILPNTDMDFDFMKASMGNAIFDGFEKIKAFNPDDIMMPLTAEQVKEITENGFAMIKTNDGDMRKVTKDDLLIKRGDANKLLDEAKEQTQSIVNSPKIITTSIQ